MRAILSAWVIAASSACARAAGASVGSIHALHVLAAAWTAVTGAVNGVIADTVATAITALVDQRFRRACSLMRTSLPSPAGASGRGQRTTVVPGG